TPGPRRLSAARSLEYRRGDAVAAVVLTAIERRIGDLQHPVGETRLAERHAIHAAQAETRGHLQALAGGLEGHPGDRHAQLARDRQGRVVSRLGHDDRELLAADARHPVDALAQLALQPRAELPEDVVTGGVTERVVDLLEVIDVAQDQR